MTDSHWKVYKCPFSCDLTFTSSFDCKNHMISEHSDMASISHVDDLVGLGAQRIDSPSSLSCPICPEKFGSIKQYQRHVGGHQEQLALFALPNLDYGGEQSDDYDEGESDENTGHSIGSSIRQDPRPQGNIDTIPNKPRIDTNWWEKMYPSCKFCGQNRGRYNYKQQDQFAQHLKVYHGLDDARIWDILAAKASESAESRIEGIRVIEPAETGTRVPAKVKLGSAKELLLIAEEKIRQGEEEEEEAEEEAEKKLFSLRQTRKGTQSSIPRFVGKRDTRIPTIRKHFEQLSREFEKERQKERNKRAAELPGSRPFLRHSKTGATIEIVQGDTGSIHKNTDVEEESAQGPRNNSPG